MFDRTVKLVSDATIGVVIVLVHVMLAERRSSIGARQDSRAPSQRSSMR